jgi:hypothetical protein
MPIASRMDIVWSLARSVDSFRLCNRAHSARVRLCPLYGMPQRPQLVECLVRRWSRRTSTFRPHEHWHWNFRRFGE